VYPEECWKETPEVYENENEKAETPFEKAWKDLEKRFHLFSVMERVDILSGVGQYGGLLLGIGDGFEMDQPVQGVNEETGEIQRSKDNALLYVRVLKETHMSIADYETDTQNPRYGQPKHYNITLTDVVGQGSSTTAKVHWSRVVHIADNRECSELMGVPRLEDVYNNILDLRKLCGGSGEMFWRGAFPGYSFELNPDVDIAEAEMDTEAIKEEFENYANGLKRYLALEGVTAKQLAPQVSDPSAHFEMEIRAIAMTKGIPYRIFMGTEESKLASSQDVSMWNGRLSKRHNQYITPYIIRPLVDRLMAAGCLPQVEEYFVEWPDMNVMAETDAADVSYKKTQSMAQYVSGDVSNLMSPLDYFVYVLGLSQELAQQVVKNTQKYLQDNPPMNPEEENEDGSPKGEKEEFEDEGDLAE
jgi:hypothetical protein